MKTRAEFAVALAGLELEHVDRAVALLWYYRQTQAFEERTATELALDLHGERFPRPNVTRLRAALVRSRFTIRGRRQGSFQIDVRRLEDLETAYGALLSGRRVQVSDAVVPLNMVIGTRAYLERIVHEINGTYDSGYYDACAVLSRRLMESLVIEVYVSKNRHHEIQHNGVFRQLDAVLAHIKSDATIPLGRGSAKVMDEIKWLGDTAAHDRTYLTQQSDIDDVRARYRRLVSELLVLAGIRT